MPLAPEMVYNDLNGEECREILETRFKDLLYQVKEFRKFMTLCRVRMTLSVKLEIAGRNPPTFEVKDDLVIRTRNPENLFPDEEAQVEEQIDINSDTLSGGQPPDQIREEHGIAIPTPTRNPQTGIIQDKPVVRSGRKWGAFTELDRGGPVVTGNLEYQNDPKIKQKGTSEVPLQQDFSQFQKDINNEARGRK